MKFLYFSIFFLLILILIKVKSDNDTELEMAISKLILNSNYNNIIPPSGLMQIYLDILFKQIVKLDQNNQILVSSSTLTAAWDDPRLAWNKSEYSLDYIILKATQVWLPDLYVINSADSNGFVPVTSFNLVQVNYDGLVTINYGLNSKYFLKLSIIYE